MGSRYIFAVPCQTLKHGGLGHRPLLCEELVLFGFLLGFVGICVRENRGTLQTLGDRTQGTEHVDLLSYLEGKHRARQRDTVFFTQVRPLVRR